MRENIENNGALKPISEQPTLQLYRLNYVRIAGKILDSTDAKLANYIRFASQRMQTEITAGDVIEHALKLFFERDAGFKNWLKRS